MLSAVLALALSGAPAAPVPSAPAAGDDRVAVLSAMSAELARSTERLRLQGYEAPYFVSYQVKDLSRHELAGRYGAIFEDTTRRDRNLYVEVELPGLKMSDLELLVSGGELTIKGQRKEECEGEDVTYHRRERGTGEFTRVVRLPVPVEADKVEGAFKAGVLTITLPKSESARMRRIEVRGE